MANGRGSAAALKIQPCSVTKATGVARTARQAAAASSP
jgi:hypothetical protein